MRKITLLLSLCALVIAGQAQEFKAIQKEDVSFEMTQNYRAAGDITDTLGLYNFLTGSPTIYGTAEGFAFGTNEYGLKGAAQGYKGNEDHNVEGVMLWVAANAIDDGDLTISIVELGDLPSTSLGSVSVPFSQVTTTTPNAGGDFFYSVIFDEPVNVSGDYAVTATWSGALTSGFGLVSTTNEDAAGADLSFIQAPTDAWQTVSSGFSLDVDLALFPMTSPAAAPTVEITFNVDMSNAELVDGDVIYVTGSFNGWDEPGTGESVMLTDEDGDMIYTGAGMAPQNDSIAYKYFLGASWTNGDPFGDRYVMTVDTDITIDPADVWNFTTTSIDEASLASVEMYPNPFNAEINLSGLNNVSNVIISNIIGQTIQTISVDAANLTVNTSDLESGIYVVTLVTENGLTRSERIVKK